MPDKEYFLLLAAEAEEEGNNEKAKALFQLALECESKER